MASFFLVYDQSIDAVCALKTFRDELLADRTAREAFKKESLLWVNLGEHPYILTAEWVEEVSGRLFVAMQYIEPDAQKRVTLTSHIARAGGPLEINQMLEWAIQFCLGMEHANAHGIECHRDIKPANILIDKGVLKISDFGLAVAAELASRGSSVQSISLVSGSAERGFRFSLVKADGKMMCGTPGYIAPEVYRCESADSRSDVYSFGLVLWQMATGSRQPPFMVQRRDNMDVFLREIYEQQMIGKLSQPKGLLGLVIAICLQPKPTNRYRGFPELRKDLEQIWMKQTGKKFAIRQSTEKPITFWINKGASLSALGRHEEAISCLDKALEIDPTDTRTWSNKGIALDNLGRYEESITCYDNALETDPQNAAAWINKGFPLSKLSRHVDAISCYEKALAIDPQKANAWIGKGSVLKFLNRNQEAIVCFNKVLAVDPRNSLAWKNKGDTLIALADHEEAVYCFSKALVIDPGNTGAWNNKGNALGNMGRAKEAIECYDATLAIDSQNQTAWYNKGNMLGTLGQQVEAINCYDEVLACYPQDSYALDNKGAALCALGHFEKAIISFSKALAINPRNPNTWENKGIALKSINKNEEAMECFNKAKEAAG